MAKQLKPDYSEIESDKLADLFEKHGPDAVLYFQEPIQGQTIRFKIGMVDPETKKTYSMESFEEKMYKIQDPPEDKPTWGKKFSFPGDGHFGKNCRIIEDWAVKQLAEEIEEDDPQGEGKLMKWNLDVKKMKKWKVVNPATKKKEFVSATNKTVNRKYQGDIKGTEEEKKEFKGVYRFPVPFNDDKTFKNIINDCSTAKKPPKGSKSKRVTIETMKDVNYDNVNEKIPGGSIIKGKMVRDFVISTYGGSVTPKLIGAIYVDPAEPVDNIERDLGDDYIAKLLKRNEDREKVTKNAVAEQNNGDDKGSVSESEEEENESD